MPKRRVPFFVLVMSSLGLSGCTAFESYKFIDQEATHRDCSSLNQGDVFVSQATREACADNERRRDQRMRDPLQVN